MRYVLTVDGVPVGFIPLPAVGRVAGHLEPFPAFDQTGLAAFAARHGEALALSHGPRARPSPRQRRLVRQVREEAATWGGRLSLLDELGSMVPSGPIILVWWPVQAPVVLVDWRLLPLGIGARRVHRLVRPGAVVYPAA